MLHPSNPRNKRVPRIRVSSVLWGQAARGRGAPSLGGRGGRRERGGPHDTICPDLQSSHTYTQPSLEPLTDARPSPSVAHANTHRGAPAPLARTDPTHTLAHRPPRTLLRRTYTHTHRPCQATATSSQPPESGNVRSCPERRKLFAEGAPGISLRRWPGPAALGRARPALSGLPAALPLPHAPHLVNRGTARGCSRPRARSPSRRPSRGTRTASCWLRGGRACAP